MRKRALEFGAHKGEKLDGSVMVDDKERKMRKTRKEGRVGTTGKDRQKNKRKGIRSNMKNIKKKNNSESMRGGGN
jgi:hypothetical protein